MISCTIPEVAADARGPFGDRPGDGRPSADEVIRRVRAAAQGSELLRAVESVCRDGGLELALGPTPPRPLRPPEVRGLQQLGNDAADWSRLRVADGFDWRTVRNCHFLGDVVLGRFRRPLRLPGGLELPSGVCNSTLADCVIGHDCLVRDVRLLAGYVVAEGALLLDCGSVTGEGATAFGNGTELSLGVECGGRDVAAYAEMDVEVAAAVAGRRSQRRFLADYARAVADYAAGATCDRGIVERGAVVRNTPRVTNTYLGPFARVEGATCVASSTLLSSEEEPAGVESGACVRDSLLQWGSRAATMAVVERAVLTEHSSVERHGKVTASLLGPNTAVGGGEVTACLLGPFVGFHHQALLIATLWPEGKGNVGYGANVGSNHTARAPDQEFRPGEGTFLGLGVNVKFPADLSRSPYTILACGVSTLPQKVAFPFSLVRAPARAGVPPSYNELVPAWVLTDNLYMLRRNESKYRGRNRARRARLVLEVFRPDTVDLMRDARRRLEAVRPVKEVYTEADLDGLGKNYLCESHRAPAIAAYLFHTRCYALLGLLRQAQKVVRGEAAGAVPHLLREPGADARWEHQRRILCDDFGLSDPAEALRALPDMLDQAARAVEQSKARDDERGRAIIDDYADAHPPAAADPFVRQTWEETRRLQREVQELLRSAAG